MRNICKSAIYIIVALFIAACAKISEDGANDATRRYFNAWMSINHPELKATWKGVEQADSNGIFLFPEEEVIGTGATVTNEGYAIVEYTVRNLDKKITAYTSEEIALQLGEYDPATYYGSRVMITMDQTILAGLQDVLVGMKVGGKRKAIIPSWFMTYSTYDKPADYLKKTTDYSHTIYEIEVKDFTDSIDVWQVDTIKRYISDKYADVGGLSAFSNDTTGYYARHDVTLPNNVKEFTSDTAIYVNYVGKLLSGHVFDTNIEKVAKDEDIFNESKSYGPVKITWAETENDLTMGDDGSSVIAGFAKTLWKLRYVERNPSWKDKCTGIFFSPLGYGYSGSGDGIPGYSPLIFEIEVVDEPEK